MNDPNPRLVVTDAQGRREVRLDRPLIALGRRSESDVRVFGVGVSRHHAEIAVDDEVCRLRDCESKLGTFVNGVRATEHVLAHGDVVRLGESHDTEIVFVIGDENISRERTAFSAAAELRHLARLLEGLRALGSGRVLDDVLALVLDSAIDVTGAERGFIMLANDEGRLDFKLGRAQGRVTLSGRTFETSRKIPEDVYAILGADGMLLFSNAGHNAPLLVSPAGVRRLETGGMVLGLFDDATFEEEAVALAPGDVIVAFSDGVSEAMNEAAEEYTDARLIASVEANRGRPPQALLGALLADVRWFCGSATPNDDVTMVVVRYEG